MEYVVLYNRGWTVDWIFCSEKDAKSLIQTLNTWIKYVDFNNGVYISAYEIKSVRSIDTLNDVELEYYKLTENEKAFLKNKEVDDNPINKIVRERWPKKGVEYIRKIRTLYINNKNKNDSTIEQDWNTK